MNVRPVAAIDLGRLQAGQRLHDEAAHRDILLLDTERQLTHFTLHFTKYAGALLSIRHGENQASLSRILTDTIIIALASANSLCIDLALAITNSDKRGAIASDESIGTIEVAMRYTEVVGAMAKACEAFDHPPEQYPSFDALRRALPELTWLTLILAASEGIDLAFSVPERWRAVEAKAKLAMGESSNRRAKISAVA